MNTVPPPLPAIGRSAALVGAILLAVLGPVFAADSGPQAPASSLTSGAVEDDRPSAPVATLAARDAQGALTLRAVRLDTPLRIDGTLDEPLYRTVTPAADFVQAEPEEGRPATERTEVWLSFDSGNVYVSFRCFESDPARIVAKEMRRDNTSIYTGDDNVTFFFDTFRDLRNGFEFTVNAIGGRVDGQTTGERAWNGDWNPVWTAKVGRFTGGWVVEAAIPFKSLRYRPGVDQVWGFNAFRTNRWKHELAFLAPIPKERGQAGLHMASLAAPLTGIAAPSGARNLELKPYAVSNVTGQRLPGRGLTNDLDGDVGLDVKYGVTQNVTADLTFNTDFAQVEADQQQVNLTRFSLFFPEKREFFLENAGTFQFGGATTGAGSDTPLLFYSRRIGLEAGRAVPIQAGGRLTGRVGRYNVGIVNIQTAADAAVGAVSTNTSVLRVKRDLLRRSSIGAMMTGRRTAQGGTPDNLTYGVDGTFSFLTNLAINTYWARSETTGRLVDNQSHRAQVSWPGDRYTLQFERLKVGRNFDPGVGFVRRRDMNRTYAQARFTPRPKRRGLVRKYLSGLAVTLVENGRGTLESRDQTADVGIEFQNADRLTLEYTRAYEYLAAPFRFPAGVSVRPGGYDFATTRLTFARSLQHQISGSLFVANGSFYDGDKTEIGVTSGRLTVLPTISLEPTYSINRVHLAQGDFTTHLAGTRATWTATPAMFTSALLQYNSDSRTVSANVRFRWEYRPGSEMFVVYNEERDTRTPRFPELASRAFIVKINRLLRF